MCSAAVVDISTGNCSRIACMFTSNTSLFVVGNEPVAAATSAGHATFFVNATVPQVRDCPTRASCCASTFLLTQRDVQLRMRKKF